MQPVMRSWRPMSTIASAWMQDSRRITLDSSPDISENGHVTTPYETNPEAPVHVPAMAVGPELVRMLMGALSGGGQAAAPTPAQLVDLLREQVQSAAHARVFLERLILELRAENADLRSANAALRQVNDELRGRL